jgi:hypothetical protein
MSVIVLPMHNFLRWIILGLLIYILFRSYLGLLRKTSWSPQDKMLGLVFTIMLDLQLVFGLLLLVDQVWSTWGRFLMEHIFPMIFAVGLAHVGKILSRRAVESTGKFRHAALWFSLVFLIIVVSIPWDRPLWINF